ncbi:unnamed protein product [Dracunculus medinensis]|uniref:ShKT domain-containing protein n=1 Tax=Dracunculus medinensis TaxID=318479 RepID=A0A0N4US24_DRAME|nr:unnamed protein product [Dracunculus medinensis]
MNPALKPLAISRCPSTCAMCCLTKQFACNDANATSSTPRKCVDRPNCAQIAHLCNSANFSTTLKQQCPVTCGGTC